MVTDNKKYNRMLAALTIAISFLFAACSKETQPVLPENTPDVAFNYFLASEAMIQAYGPTRGRIYIHVDNYVDYQKILSGTAASPPTLSIGYNNTSMEYPWRRGTEVINYERYRAGDHRFFLTDVFNNVVLDTIISSTPASFNCLYLADGIAINGAEAQYKIVLLPEERSAVEGKTQVRFVHLSPDAGKISCKLKRSDGSTTDVTTLGFGEASSYVAFDSTQTTEGLFRFVLNTTDGYEIATGAPNSAGHNYVVMITGFRNTQQRQVATDKSADGALIYKTITINPGLKTELRSTY